MTPSVERDLGELNAKVARLEDEMREIRRDVRTVRDAVVSANGGWRMLVMLGSSAGVVGALTAKIIPMLTMR